MTTKQMYKQRSMLMKFNVSTVLLKIVKVQKQKLWEMRWPMVSVGSPGLGPGRGNCVGGTLIQIYPS